MVDYSDQRQHKQYKGQLIAIRKYGKENNWMDISSDKQAKSPFAFLGITDIIYSLEFFTSAWADGLSLEFEWQQVSSSLLDSSKYSGRSQ